MLCQYLLNLYVATGEQLFNLGLEQQEQPLLLLEVDVRCFQSAHLQSALCLQCTQCGNSPRESRLKGSPESENAFQMDSLSLEEMLFVY